MIPPKRTNTVLISVVAISSLFGLAFVGILVWFVLWFLPHSPRAFGMYARRGNARYEQGDYQGAVEAYNQAVETSPRDSRGYSLRAQAYYRFRSYRAALADYAQVLKYATRDDIKRDAHYYSGECFRHIHQWANAIPEYIASIRLGEHRSNVYAFRGDSYYHMKDYRHALSDLNIAIDKDPKEVDLYISRGDIFLALHRYGPAVEDIAFAIRLDPDDAPLRGSLGWAQYLDGKIDAAIQTDREVLSMQDDLGSVHGNLGLCYAVRENWAAAQPEYARAAKLSSPSELAGVTQDVREVLKTKPNSVALKNALSTMTTAVTQGQAKNPRGLIRL